MKYQKNIIKKLNLSLIISSVFTLFSLLFYFYIVSGGLNDISQAVGFWLALFIHFVLPILFLGVWGISVKYYVIYEIEVLGGKGCNNHRFKIYSSTAILFMYGLLLFYFIVLFGEYFLKHRLYIDELKKWVSMMIGLTIICVIQLLLILLKRRKNITLPKCIFAILFSSILFLALLMSSKYIMENAEEKAFWIRLHKSVDFTEEHGPNVDNPYLP